MPTDLTLFHNPRCGTSRRALELLRERGREPRIVLYLETGWTRQGLETLRRALSARPIDLLRGKEPLAAELGLLREDVTGDRIVEAMIANPVLVERPIVVAGDIARIGRPAERVLEVI